MDTQWIYRLALTFIQGIGVQSAKILMAYGGSAEEVFRLKRKALYSIPGLARTAADRLWKERDEALRRAEKEWSFIQQEKIRPLFFLDDDFPARLRHCYDGPVVLFQKGPAALNVSRVLGIVGTRWATGYGLEKCADIVAGLKDKGILIISGLAYGIDVQAHQASLQHGLSTAAVLGHGLDRIYPALHGKVAERMCQTGALITEFVSGSKPDRENFPRRNRIVAGMVDALLVVESGITGGSLITASLAGDYNRDVFALPGRVGDPWSAGCHALIKNNRAALVENAEDILSAMNWLDTKKNRAVQMTAFPECTPEEQSVLDQLKPQAELPVDEIGARLKWTPARVSSILLAMEFKGLVEVRPGKRYRPAGGVG